MACHFVHNLSRNSTTVSPCSIRSVLSVTSKWLGFVHTSTCHSGHVYFHSQKCIHSSAASTWLQCRWPRANHLGQIQSSFLQSYSYGLSMGIKSFEFHVTNFCRGFSTKQNSSANSDALSESDPCLVFDAKDMLINSVSTVAAAQALADKQNVKLTYLSKNQDGIHCFRLGASAKSRNMLSGTVAKNNSSSHSAKRKKPEKQSAKEFTIKASIKDHDLSVKVNKIHNLLVKGKQVVIFYKSERASSPSKDFKGSASDFSKKLSSDLKEICDVHQDFSNDNACRFTLSPLKKEDSEE